MEILSFQNHGVLQSIEKTILPVLQKTKSLHNRNLQAIFKNIFSLNKLMQLLTVGDIQKCSLQTCCVNFK